jgi:hypothetical protein
VKPPTPLKFAVAPHFHLPIDWSKRLRTCPGNQLAPLIQSDPAEQHSCVLLFALPQHLRARWWAILEQSADSLGKGSIPGFDDFARRVGEFLSFKQLSPPDDSQFDAVVHADALSPHTWGLINLGEGELTVVFPTSRLRLVIHPGEGVRLPELAIEGPINIETNSGPLIQLRITRAYAARLCDHSQWSAPSKEIP